MSDSPLNRRAFLRIGTLSLLAMPRLVAASTSGEFLKARSRSLSFYNLHTTEKLSAVYWADGDYIPESLSDINRILRDYRTGEICEIEPRLLDSLCALHMRLETAEPFELISGYRSPTTNAMLRNQGHGVAENSLHIKGMAADVRIPGRSLALLRRTAISLKAGGVGYYPASQFVHIDVGRVRTW
jgi:uncharacterized protein YcbK (DUF882 family)